MKTAEEWATEQGQSASALLMCPCSDHQKRFVELIEAIQRDAIEAAAKVIRDEMNTRPTFWGVYGREPLGRLLIDEIRALAPVRR